MADYLNDLSTYEIFRSSIDWSNPVDAEFELSQEVNSYSGTIDELVTFSDERPFNCELPLVFLTKQEEYEFIDFFISHKGRWKKFWLPSPHSFFEVDQAITNGQSYIVVKDREFREAHRGFERLLIELENGDFLTFKIASVTAGPGPGQEKIDFFTTFDRDIEISEILKCSFIYLGRFDFDKIQFEYKTSTCSSVSQKFLELVKEYP